MTNWLAKTLGMSKVGKIRSSCFVEKCWTINQNWWKESSDVAPRQVDASYTHLYTYKYSISLTLCNISKYICTYYFYYVMFARTMVSNCRFNSLFIHGFSSTFLSIVHWILCTFYPKPKEKVYLRKYLYFIEI